MNRSCSAKCTLVQCAVWLEETRIWSSFVASLSRWPRPTSCPDLAWKLTLLVPIALSLDNTTSELFHLDIGAPLLSLGLTWLLTAAQLMNRSELDSSKLCKFCTKNCIKFWTTSSLFVTTNNELMGNWWITDEELIKNWWRNDKGVMKNWWRIDEELMKSW